MPDDPTLTLEPRSLTGKKVKQMRRKGIIPANVYGRGLESVSVQAPLAEFRRVFRAVPRNAVVQARIAGEDRDRPVVLRAVARHPVSREVLHVDLYQVDLTRVIQSSATIVITGRSEAVAVGGTLVQSLDAIPLEALPDAIPSEIVVDVSSLTEFGHSIHVGDLDLPDGVRALTDATAQIVTVVAPRLIEEEEEEPALEGVEAVEGEEAEAGAAPTEGGEPAAESGAEDGAASAARRGR